MLSLACCLLSGSFREVTVLVKPAPNGLRRGGVATGLAALFGLIGAASITGLIGPSAPSEQLMAGETLIGDLASW